MLQSILSHTPVYVWAILGFLVYRGIKASADRDVPFRSVFIIPVVMLGLSMQGISNSFGLLGLAPWLWLCGAAVGAALTRQLADPRAVAAHPQQGSITIRGSCLPLAMMMAIFCTKYVVAVTLVMHHEYSAQFGFMAAVCGAYGLFSGVFIGKLLVNVAAYRQAGDSLAAA